jgi:hypothetical protein
MTLRRTWLVAAILAAVTVTGAGTAYADGGGNSDAAQGCGVGPQLDLYLVSGQEPGTEADIDFGALQHGVTRVADVPYAYVATDDHGQCVSFFARKATGKGGKVTVNDIRFVRSVDKSSP